MMQWIDKWPISVEHVLELPQAPSCRVLSATVYVNVYDIPYLVMRFEEQPWLGRHVVDEPASWVLRCCNDYSVIVWFNFEEQQQCAVGPETCPAGGRCRLLDAAFCWMRDRLNDDDLLPAEE